MLFKVKVDARNRKGKSGGGSGVWSLESERWGRRVQVGRQGGLEEEQVEVGDLE